MWLCMIYFPALFLHEAVSHFSPYNHLTAACSSFYPGELFGGLLGVLSRRCWSLRSCVESVKEPEDSSPVPTWILG